MPNAILTFRTRKAKLAAKKQGRIEGYFASVAKGRPKKEELPMNKTKKAVIDASKKAHTPACYNWNQPENFPALKAAVIAHLNREANDDITGIGLGIPRSTLQRHVTKFQDVSAELSMRPELLTREMIFSSTRGGGKKLLDDHEIELLSSAMIYRDESNNGMSRNEAISLIMELAQMNNRKKAENHLEHLVRTKQLKGLKNNGRVVKAQATTTKRSQIQVEQQLRWHTTVDDTLAEMRRLNQPAAAFAQLEDHFFGNFDENCLMANADGSVRVMASNTKKKTEKNTDDSRASITSLRVGMASGEQGPFTFLAKGSERFNRPSLQVLLKTRCPKGSQIIMSPLAYMTDETYQELVPEFCRGMRDMPVIRDHPDWWVTLTCDGFGSHVNVEVAHKVFNKHKSFVVKEEGDSSHVNQSYDQIVAKQDKAWMRNHLSLVRRKLGSKQLDQWTLIALAIDAQLKITKDDWIKSHKRVNAQPSSRVPFDLFIMQLDERGVLIPGEKFFDKRKSLIDAMPACWTKLSVEQRHSVISIVKATYDRAASDQAPVHWTKEDIIKLARFAKLEDVYKFRACYLNARKDPSVIVGSESDSEAIAATTVEAPKNVQDFFSFQPTKLLREYKANRKDSSVQTKLFHHMTNFAAQSMWNAKKSLEPSSCLDVSITEQQKDLLTPTCKNTLMGFILYDVKGKGAKNKVAKRCIDMISGNMSSHSRCLNDVKRLKQLEEVNQLTATVAEVTAEAAATKKEQQVKAAQKLKAKKTKKKEDDAKEASKRAEALPGLQAIMDDFINGNKTTNEFGNLTVTVLVNILKYFYTDRPKGLAKMSKQSLVEEVLKRFETAAAAEQPI